MTNFYSYLYNVGIISKIIEDISRSIENVDFEMIFERFINGIFADLNYEDY